RLVGESRDDPEQDHAVERNGDRAELGIPELVAKCVPDRQQQAATHQQRSTTGADRCPSSSGERKNGGNDRHTKEYLTEVAECGAAALKIPPDSRPKPVGQRT